jgi:hypothetical protein
LECGQSSAAFGSRPRCVSSVDLLPSAKLAAVVPKRQRTGRTPRPRGPSRLGGVDTRVLLAPAQSPWQTERRRVNGCAHGRTNWRPSGGRSLSRSDAGQPCGIGYVGSLYKRCYQGDANRINTATNITIMDYVVCGLLFPNFTNDQTVGGTYRSQPRQSAWIDDAQM